MNRELAAFSWLKTFIKFAAVSGVGLGCDLAIFSTLLMMMSVATIVANVISSFCGLTFVYLVSVRMVFKKCCRYPRTNLTIYLCYHGISISAYSFVVAWLGEWLRQIFPTGGEEPVLLAKLFVTPCILSTNFLFMWLFTNFMEDRACPKPEERVIINNDPTQRKVGRYAWQEREVSNNAEILN